MFTAVEEATIERCGALATRVRDAQELISEMAWIAQEDQETFGDVSERVMDLDLALTRLRSMLREINPRLR